MTYVDSIDCGFPLENRALTSVVEISPSSSTMNIPVTSPDADVLASKTLGLSKLKVAIPLDPSLARVSLILGMTFSSRPRTNWMDPFNCDVARVVAGTGAKALESEAVATRRAVVNMDFIVEIGLDSLDCEKVCVIFCFGIL